MENLVVKHNALANASYSLSLAEQRLILLAIVDARKSGKHINADSLLTIHASSYMEQFGVEKHTAYKILKEATNNLFNRQFSYVQPYNGSLESVKSRWVSKVSYINNEATVRLVFSPDIVPLITKLEQHFTQYAIEQISELNSTYSVRLYEILMSWRGTQKTGFIELSELRNQLGVESSDYTRMSDFKRRVLDLSVSQVNKHTDITAKYKQHKSGRKITGFSFYFSFKTAKAAAKAKLHYTRNDLDKNPKLANPGESHTQALTRLNNRTKTLGTEEEQTAFNL